MTTSDDKDPQELNPESDNSAGQEQKQSEKQSYKERMKEILNNREEEYYDEGEE